MYLPGIAETNQTDSKLTSALITVLVAFVDCMLGKFMVGDPPASNQFVWGVFSRVIGGSAFPVNNSGFKDIVAVRANQVIGSMRSRRVGRGV
jgi:hypothetical protein